LYAAVVLKYYKPPPRPAVFFYYYIIKYRMERINSSEELLSETSEWKYYSKENEEDIIRILNQNNTSNQLIIALINPICETILILQNPETMTTLAEAGTDDHPRLFVSPGCPYALKVMIFLNDSGLTDKVKISPDTPETRKYVRDKCNGQASFPAMELSGRILQMNDVDEMVEFLAEKHGTDVKSLYTFNDYCTGVFPRYRMMLGRVIKEVGGWPKAFPAIGIRKVLVLGASGMVGSCIAREAALRGHQVTCASRKGDVQVDANDSEALAKILENMDVVVVAMGPSRKKGDNAPRLEVTYRSIVAACKSTSTWAMFVGGAGSSMVAPGQMVIDLPGFPDFVKNEAMQHVEALAYLRTLDDSISWTSLTPPQMIQPGKRTGKYRTGKDDLVKAEGGSSSISAEDFAVAMLDILAKDKHENERITVGY
jgi:putative NADH-flavin reductase